MMNKTCTKCKKYLPISSFYIKRKVPTIVYYSECKMCRLERSRNKSNPNWFSKYFPETRQILLTAQEKKDRRNTYNRRRNKEIKASFLNLYGNKCECCGEDKKEFLTLEHRNGQKGVKHSKKETGIKSYVKAIKEYRPDLYTILCWNCNCSKGRYGYCPHQR